jgi:ferredoxin-type protein NapG
MSVSEETEGAELGIVRAPVDRRSFISGAAGAAAVFGLGGAVKVWGGDRRLLRPPGAQNESVLFERCIRCERCSMVCPLRAIRLGRIEDGLLNARTPKMDFRRGYCDFCDGDPKCAASCPVGCFSPFDSKAEKIGLAVVDTKQCLLYHASAQCSKRCLDVCNFEALYLDESGFLHVDEDNCNGCGACEYFCPSASYQIYLGSPNRGVNIELFEKRT